MTKKNWFEIPEGGLMASGPKGGGIRGILAKRKKGKGIRGLFGKNPEEELKELRQEEKMLKVKERVEILRQRKQERERLLFQKRKERVGEAYGKAKMLWNRIKTRKKSIYD